MNKKAVIEKIVNGNYIKEKLHSDGHTYEVAYRIMHAQNPSVIWECSNKKSLSCKARVTTYVDNGEHIIKKFDLQHNFECSLSSIDSQIIENTTNSEYCSENQFFSTDRDGNKNENNFMFNKEAANTTLNENLDQQISNFENDVVMDASMFAEVSIDAESENNSQFDIDNENLIIEKTKRENDILILNGYRYYIQNKNVNSQIKIWKCSQKRHRSCNAFLTTEKLSNGKYLIKTKYEKHCSEEYCKIDDLYFMSSKTSTFEPNRPTNKLFLNKPNDNIIKDGITLEVDIRNEPVTDLMENQEENLIEHDNDVVMSEETFNASQNKSKEEHYKDLNIVKTENEEIRESVKTDALVKIDWYTKINLAQSNDTNKKIIIEKERNIQSLYLNGYRYYCGSIRDSIFVNWRCSNKKTCNANVDTVWNEKHIFKSKNGQHSKECSKRQKQLILQLIKNEENISNKIPVNPKNETPKIEKLKPGFEKLLLNNFFFNLSKRYGTTYHWCCIKEGCNASIDTICLKNRIHNIKRIHQEHKHPIPALIDSVLNSFQNDSSEDENNLCFGEEIDEDEDEDEDMIWDSENLTKLIKELEQNRCLWKKSDPNYINNGIKTQIYIEIAAKLGPPFTYKTVVDKVENLKKMCLQEKKKMTENKSNSNLVSNLQFLINEINEEQDEDPNNLNSDDDFITEYINDNNLEKTGTNQNIATFGKSASGLFNLILNGYTYIMKDKRKAIHQWICTRKEKDGCESRICTERLENGKHIIKGGNKHEHCHPPNAINKSITMVESIADRCMISDSDSVINNVEPKDKIVEKNNIIGTSEPASTVIKNPPDYEIPVFERTIQGGIKLIWKGFTYFCKKYPKDKSKGCYFWLCKKGFGKNGICKSRVKTKLSENGEHIIVDAFKEHCHDKENLYLETKEEPVERKTTNLFNKLKILESTNEKDKLIIGKTKGILETETSSGNFDENSFFFSEDVQSTSLIEETIWDTDILTKLINELEQNICLWKKSDPNFYNNEFKIQKYKEIAAKLGPPITYQNVIDKVEELKKIYVQERGKITENISNKNLVSSLTFLNDESCDELDEDLINLDSENEIMTKIVDIDALEKTDLNTKILLAQSNNINEKFLIGKSNKNQYLFLNGYKYNLRYIKEPYVRWQCSNRFGESCTAGIQTIPLLNGKHVVYRKSNQHTSECSDKQRILLLELLGKNEKLKNNRAIIGNIKSKYKKHSHSAPTEELSKALIESIRDRIFNQQNEYDEYNFYFGEKLEEEETIWNYKNLAKLVNLIEPNGCLWKKSDPNFHNIELKIQIFKEIAKKISSRITFKNVYEKLEEIKKMCTKGKIKIVENTSQGNLLASLQFLIDESNDENDENFNNYELEHAIMTESIIIGKSEPASTVIEIPKIRNPQHYETPVFESTTHGGIKMIWNGFTYFCKRNPKVKIKGCYFWVCKMGFGKNRICKSRVKTKLLDNGDHIIVDAFEEHYHEKKNLYLETKNDILSENEEHCHENKTNLYLESEKEKGALFIGKTKKGMDKLFLDGFSYYLAFRKNKSESRWVCSNKHLSCTANVMTITKSNGEHILKSSSNKHKEKCYTAKQKYVSISDKVLTNSKGNLTMNKSGKNTEKANDIHSHEQNIIRGISNIINDVNKDQERNNIIQYDDGNNVGFSEEMNKILSYESKKDHNDDHNEVETENEVMNESINAEISHNEKYIIENKNEKNYIGCKSEDIKCNDEKYLLEQEDADQEEPLHDLIEHDVGFSEEIITSLNKSNPENNNEIGESINTSDNKFDKPEKGSQLEFINAINEEGKLIIGKTRNGTERLFLNGFMFHSARINKGSLRRWVCRNNKSTNCKISVITRIMPNGEHVFQIQRNEHNDECIKKKGIYRKGLRLFENELCHGSDISFSKEVVNESQNKSNEDRNDDFNNMETENEVMEESDEVQLKKSKMDFQFDYNATNEEGKIIIGKTRNGTETIFLNGYMYYYRFENKDSPVKGWSCRNNRNLFCKAYIATRTMPNGEYVLESYTNEHNDECIASNKDWDDVYSILGIENEVMEESFSEDDNVDPESNLNFSQINLKKLIEKTYKGNTILILNGYDYDFSKINKKSHIKWTCSNRTELLCNAKVVTIPSTETKKHIINDKYNQHNDECSKSKNEKLILLKSKVEGRAKCLIGGYLYHLNSSSKMSSRWECKNRKGYCKANVTTTPLSNGEPIISKLNEHSKECTIKQGLSNEFSKKQNVIKIQNSEKGNKQGLLKFRNFVTDSLNDEYIINKENVIKISKGGNGLLFYNGYKHYAKRKAHSVMRWLCSNRQKFHCKASIITERLSDGKIIVIRKNQKHSSDCSNIEDINYKNHKDFIDVIEYVNKNFMVVSTKTFMETEDFTETFMEEQDPMETVMEDETNLDNFMTQAESYFDDPLGDCNENNILFSEERENINDTFLNKTYNNQEIDNKVYYETLENFGNFIVSEMKQIYHQSKNIYFINDIKTQINQIIIDGWEELENQNLMI